MNKEAHLSSSWIHNSFSETAVGSSAPGLVSLLPSFPSKHIHCVPILGMGAMGWEGRRAREKSSGKFISLFIGSQLHWGKNSVIQWKYLFPTSFWTSDPNIGNGRPWDWWRRDLGKGRLSRAQNSLIHSTNQLIISNPKLTEWPLCVEKPTRLGSKSHLCWWVPKRGWIRSQGSC